MKLLLIIGKSGTGKTTLAKKIESLKPSAFKRIVQYTSREMRETEKDGDDYFFITKNEFNVRSSQLEFFAEVKSQFPPSYYGTPYAALDKKKTNIVVASIEGILDTFTKFKSYSGITVLNITEAGDGVEAERNDGRNANAEEKYNQIVINKLKDIAAFKKVKFVDIKHEDLKVIRNDNKQLLKFLKINKIK